MMEIAPESAFVLNGDETEEVDHSGGRNRQHSCELNQRWVPLDGVVIEGESFIDTSARQGNLFLGGFLRATISYPGCEW